MSHNFLLRLTWHDDKASSNAHYQFVADLVCVSCRLLKMDGFVSRPTISCLCFWKKCPKTRSFFRVWNLKDTSTFFQQSQIPLGHQIVSVMAEKMVVAELHQVSRSTEWIPIIKWRFVFLCVKATVFRRLSRPCWELTLVTKTFPSCSPTTSAAQHRQGSVCASDEWRRHAQVPLLTVLLSALSGTIIDSFFPFSKIFQCTFYTGKWGP